jgi:hypothetical protein
MFGLNFAFIDPDTALGEADQKSFVIFSWDIGYRYLFKPKADLTPFVGGGMGLNIITEQRIRDKDDYSYYEEEDPYIKRDAAVAFHLSTGVYGFQSYSVHMSF